MTTFRSTLFALIVLPAFSSPAFAQSRIGMKLLPGITDSRIPGERQLFQDRLQSRFTFNFGVQFIFPVKDSTLFIETGIYYADRGSVQRDFVSEYYTPQGNYTKTSDIYVHSYFYSLPVMLRFERNWFFAAAGGTVDLYSHTRLIWTPEEDKVETTSWRPSGFSNTVKFGAIVNAGVQFPVTARLRLFAEASFSASDFSRDPVNKNYSFYWNYLLGPGLAFKL